MFQFHTIRVFAAIGPVHRFAALLALLLASHLVRPALGQAPHVEFDVTCLTPVTEVEDASPGLPYREIEARFPISILLTSGRQNQLSEVVIRIESRHRRAEVVDYAPRTRLASSIVGNVAVTERGDERKQAQINLFGVAPAAPTVNGNATAGYSNERQATWSYERLPPPEVLVASGTTDRGFGAFFKFRPSSQASLEGSHDVMLRLRVPRNWRSEIYDVTAIAYARRGSEFSFDDRPIAGQETFTVVLYQAGDLEARRIAAQMASDEEKFRAIVFRDRKAIERKAFPTPLEKVGNVIGVVGPKLPENWYRDLLNGDQDPNGVIIPNLPRHVQAAATAMIASRATYEEMRRSPLTPSKRHQPTQFTTRMASGGPELSAKKPDSVWKPRNGESAEKR
jgi:hypothetical protein